MKSYTELSKEFLDLYFRENPTMATHFGVHEYDHNLEELSAMKIRERTQRMAQWLQAFVEIPEASLSEAEALDRDLLVRLLKNILRGEEKRGESRRNPDLYLEPAVYGIYLLVTREFAPPKERLASIVSRLKQVPRILEEGKANLQTPPQIWVETAMEMGQGALGLFEVLLPAFARQVGELQDELGQVLGPAVESIKSYVAFLKDLLPLAQGEFAVGEEEFTWMLQEYHLLPYDANGLIAKGWELYRETEAQLEAVARQIDPEKSWSELVEELKADHPTPEDLLQTYQREMDRSKAFVMEREIAHIPAGEQLVVEETPGFLRGLVPYAAYSPPAPFEKERVGRFYVTPVNPGLSSEDQAKQLEGHALWGIPTTALHEGYPGHHLQLVWANNAPTVLRRIFHSTLFIEGWAFYCEQLMEDLGFLSDPRQRLFRLQAQIWRAARIIIDGSLHTKQMSVDEAVDFLVEKAGLERVNAITEVKRYTGSPTQPMSYLMGKLEIMDLVEKVKAKYPGLSLRQLHAKILEHGSIPPRAIGKALGV